jgi:methylated-DNA-protein-cysteine methyltransferase related protein
MLRPLLSLLRCAAELVSALSNLCNFDVLPQPHTLCVNPVYSFLSCCYTCVSVPFLPRVETVATRSRKRLMSWNHVYRLVKQIPRGRVLSYGALARTLRLPGGARTAGRAMSACPSGKGIPWHRVLGANGKLLIREPYASLQRRLLESEGVAVSESRVNMKRHAWTPASKTIRSAKKKKGYSPANSSN